MTNLWATDHELFLHAGKDGVVKLWRCTNYKEIISTTPSSLLSSMLMKPEDFTQEGPPVTNHLCLFGERRKWDKDKYKALIDYISPKRLLVNRLGSVIVEIETDDKAAPLVYIRGLDVLAMGPFGPNIRPVPSSWITVRYLQDAMFALTGSSDGSTVDPTRPTTESSTDDQPSTRETKLTQNLIAKTKQVETLQTELEKEKKDNGNLAKRVKELEDEAAIKNSSESTYTTVRIHTKAATKASLTIHDGQVMLKRYIDEDDDFFDQCWVKDDKYGESIKDSFGFPSFALVNKFSGLAMKHSSTAKLEPVKLVPYNPFVVDESILWSQHKQDDGYSAIRMVNNIHLNLQLDASNVVDDDGTSTTNYTINLGEWLAGDNQKWKMVPYCK